MNWVTIGLSLCVVLLLSACETAPRASYDYTAFKARRPSSILVLPPLSDSPDVNATWGMLSSVTFPLSEAGYYVVPVAVMTETFRQNGLTHPAEIHAVKLEKLRGIFGNDAVLYIHVKEYGTQYLLLESVTSVSAEARLVDARTGQLLWQGSASASDAGARHQHGLLGALILAVVDQVAGIVSDKAYDMAQIAGNRLLSPQSSDGILYGPRSEHYQKETASPNGV